MQKINLLIIIFLVTIYIILLSMSKWNILYAFGAFSFIAILPLPLILMKNKIHYILAVLLLLAINLYGEIRVNKSSTKIDSLADMMKINKDEAYNKIKISENSFKEFSDGFQNRINNTTGRLWIDKTAYIASSNYKEKEVVLKFIILKEALAETYAKDLNIDKIKMKNVMDTHKFKDLYLKDIKDVNKKAYCLVPVFKVLFEKGLILRLTVQYDDGEVIGQVKIKNTDCNAVSGTNKKVDLDKYRR